MGKKKEEEPKAQVQENLFGEEDFLFNFCETELADITAGIESKYKKMERIEGEIQKLEGKKAEAKRAVEITKNKRDALKPEKGEPTEGEEIEGEVVEEDTKTEPAEEEVVEGTVEEEETKEAELPEEESSDDEEPSPM